MSASGDSELIVAELEVVLLLVDLVPSADDVDGTSSGPSLPVMFKVVGLASTSSPSTNLSSV